jgi:[acyl-carrier-protein] S-malonyltransferase
LSSLARLRKYATGANWRVSTAAVNLRVAMSGLAFVYPGQGSQRPGMGAALLEAEPELHARYLGAADEASGLPVRELSLEGPADELTRTDVAQPALFALSLAITDVARRVGLEPSYVAGHSLGEYTAAVAAGALDWEDGMRLVCERGRLMAQVQDERPGAMAAVMGMPEPDLAALCEQAAADSGGAVSLANLNSPGQIVVSGEEAAVDRLVELAKEAGARKARRLPVGAAFHSELMRGVQARLDEATRAIEWRDARVPLVSNASGAPVQAAGDVRAALVAQIASPVRWVDCVNALTGAGVDSFVELGPGKVLSGLIGQIAPDAAATPADSPAKLAELASSARA